jgi:hypothetical protein
MHPKRSACAISRICSIPNGIVHIWRRRLIAATPSGGANLALVCASPDSNEPDYTEGNKGRMALDHPRAADRKACLRAEIAMNVNDCGKVLVMGIPILPSRCRSGESAVDAYLWLVCPVPGCEQPTYLASGLVRVRSPQEWLGHWAATVASRPGIHQPDSYLTFASRDGQARFGGERFPLSALLYLQGTMSRDALHAWLLTVSNASFTPPRS